MATYLQDGLRMYLEQEFGGTNTLYKSYCIFSMNQMQRRNRNPADLCQFDTSWNFYTRYRSKISPMGKSLRNIINHVW